MINMAALGGFLFPAALHDCTLVLHHPLDVPLYLRQLQEEADQLYPGATAAAESPGTAAGLVAAGRLRRVTCDWFRLRTAVAIHDCDLRERLWQTDYQFLRLERRASGLISTPDNSPSPEQRAALFPRLGAADTAFESWVDDAILTCIVDPDSGERIDTPGQPGELCVAGPGVFDGYLNHDGSGLFTDDGYFRTGDLVEISASVPTHYRIVGRCKDIINRGGVKAVAERNRCAVAGRAGRCRSGGVCGSRR
jgi:acyl-CoA synthetase (AMP-forming)/AMP-acid ligase II